MRTSIGCVIHRLQLLTTRLVVFRTGRHRQNIARTHAHSQMCYTPHASTPHPCTHTHTHTHTHTTQHITHTQNNTTQHTHAHAEKAGWWLCRYLYNFHGFTGSYLNSALHRLCPPYCVQSRWIRFGLASTLLSSRCDASRATSQVLAD